MLLFLGLSLKAQAPQGFNYQATVRNASGDLVVNQNVSFSFDIIQGSQTADPTYSEDHTLLTDDLGQVSLVIGQGTPTTSVFSEIDWSIGNYYLAIELDTGNGFEPMGTSQLFSVPYALYAENAGGSLPQGISNGDTLKWNASTSSWEISSSTSSANNAFEVKSTQVNYYSNNSASSGGEIIADGGSSVIARGVVWGINPDPTIDGDKTNDGAGSGIFTSELTNLAESTTYYYRAYATNSNRTVYGSTYSFQTMNSADDNDGDGYTVADGDCNDLDFNINPSAFEIQDDGIDQNCDGTDSLSPVYLSSNGVTIKAHSWASFGDVGTVNGKEYVVINRETLISMVSQGMDYSAVCTSLISDMSEVFKNRTKSSNISSWDTSIVTNMNSMFESSFLGVNHEMNLWDVSKVVDMSSMFSLSNFNGYIYAWDTSSVTDMNEMFLSVTEFNQSIANWNTSSVTDMSLMFYNAQSFNQNLSSWDTSNVTNMYSMFQSATAFNQNLSSWDTSNVTNMYSMFQSAYAFNSELDGWSFGPEANLTSMFQSATAFNQNLSSWDTSNVTNMYGMFYNATAFNQNLSSWDTSNVTNMYGMFYNATAFNQNLSSWDTSNVTNMNQMFYSASAFNGELDGWSFGPEANLSSMFQYATAFNQNLSSWDTSNVTNMSLMFYYAQSFNQNLSSWDTSNVTNMYSMFQSATAFNQNLSSWDTSNVTNMYGMFQSATAFNQDLSSWDVSSVANYAYFDYNTPQWTLPKPNFN